MFEGHPVKLLTGCLLVLLIIILIPIAASCAGISILAIGGGAVVHDVLTLPTAAPGSTKTPVYFAPNPTRAPTDDPGIFAAQKAALVKFDLATKKLDAKCTKNAGSDVDAQASCVDDHNARLDVRGFLQDCFDQYIGVIGRPRTLADIAACVANYP